MLFENEKQLENAKENFIKDVSMKLDPHIIALAASARKRAASSIHSSADGNGKAEESKSNIFLEDLMLVNE